MILTAKKPAQGDYLVAQNTSTYECLVFSETGTPVEDYLAFQGYGRYKPMSGKLPLTELDLRVEFFTILAASKIKAAKQHRDSQKLQPLNGFDFDEAAQANIAGAIDSFDAVVAAAVSIGHPADGTIPWVKEDNSTVSVTLQDLKDLRDAGAARALMLHVEYTQARLSAEAMIPVVVQEEPVDVGL